MRRFLIIFALALIPIQAVLYLVWQYYSIPLTVPAAIMRMLGGAVAAGYIAWRIDRQMGGARKKPDAQSAGSPIYQRPTPDQLAGLGGKPPESSETPPEPAAPGSLRDRLQQQQTKRD